MVPVYLRFMGIEAYGLVGFFGMMQGWLQLIDMGLSATLSREVTRYRAGKGAEDLINSMLRALSAMFLGFCLTSSVIIWIASSWIANSWLNASSISPQVLGQCISLMGLAAAFRVIAGLYRGIINGWEKQVWLGGYSVFIATLRFVAVVAVFVWVSADALTFFTFQLIVSVFELVILFWKAGTLLPGVWSWPSLKFGPLLTMWHFSGALAFGYIVGVLVFQTDKLVLSKTLTLLDYGYFATAMVVANGINIIASPISGALLPRLTYLFTVCDHTSLLTLWFSLLNHSCSRGQKIMILPIKHPLFFSGMPWEMPAWDWLHSNITCSLRTVSYACM